MSTQVPLQYAASVCNLFAQLDVRGSSVLFASGDSGYDFYASPCTDMLIHISRLLTHIHYLDLVIGIYLPPFMLW
jgi:hypothetical protein